MDEPFAALDEITRFRLNNDLADALAVAVGKTVVFVTHSVFESVYLSQRIVVMTARPGRVVHRARRSMRPIRGRALPHLRRNTRRCAARASEALRRRKRSEGGGMSAGDPAAPARRGRNRARCARCVLLSAGRGAGARRAGLGSDRAAERDSALCAARARGWCSTRWSRTGALLFDLACWSR